MIIVNIEFIIYHNSSSLYSVSSSDLHFTNITVIQLPPATSPNNITNQDHHGNPLNY